MPLFAFHTGTPTGNADLALRDLQTWLDLLGTEEYTLLTEELRGEPTGPERPMISRTNAVIEKLKALYHEPGTPDTWGLVVKERL